MPWSRYDDELSMNKKIGRLLAKGEPGAAAIGLHLLSNTWARHQGTGGHIESHVPGQLVGNPRLGRKLAALLEEVRMFDVHAAGGWQIHDFDEFGDPNDPNPNRSTAERRREISEKRAEAGRLGGLAKAGKRSSNASGLPVANAEQTSSPGPDPEPVLATGTPDDDRHQPDATSSSLDDTVELYADIVASYPRNQGKDLAWRRGVEANVRRERGAEIQRHLGMGLAPRAIAEILTGKQAPLELQGYPEPPMHPSVCHCEGRGNGTHAGELSWDDNGRSYAAPCPGPDHPHPQASYLDSLPTADIIPIRSRTPA